ncbi:MAG TPA: SRPBCC domain-containing protein [Vicinamibacterales bacterium]|nr:SRPBCC domain-containing protein [Vicinamibacterales bacterium]
MTDLLNRPQITQTRGAFVLLCRVEVSIQSSPGRIWKLLTNARDFPRWNSTVTAIEGEIDDGHRIRIHVPGTQRTFVPTISNVIPDARMTWTGGFAPLFKGVRTFELTPQPGDSTTFVMQERFSGLMLPFVGRTLPDFGPVFERYATDLKREAERTHT